jgi:rhamnulose-1-phosphate aldolase/alcohol dehydrogenase
VIQSLWRPEAAANLTGVDRLVYRSNLLGADRRVCNWGGGNTSIKTLETDFRGRPREVLWVKGSGSDLATATRRSFTPLFLEDVVPLLSLDAMSDEEMVAYLSNCVMGQGHPRQSIETLLHAFLPFPHIDHTHPDAIISLACAEGGQEIAREIFGDELVWVPYLRPGFLLSKLIAEAVAAHPPARLVVMEKHGLITWGDTAEECYAATIAVISRAERWIAERAARKPLFGDAAVAALEPAERRALLSRLLPTVRGAVSRYRGAVLQVDQAEDVMTFVGSRDGARLSQVGAACPDHLVHTKRVPLWVDWSPTEEKNDPETLREALLAGLDRFADEYRAYAAEHRSPDDPEGDPFPRVILIPGVGMITTGKDKANADIAAQLFHRALSVMAGAEALSRFVSLTPAESYAVEYWPLELYKLSLAPPERELSRRVALVTGGAGGIGKAVADRLAREGAHVVAADLNGEGARAVAEELCRRYGHGRGLALAVDVTDEAAVEQAFAETVLAYGGLDVLISNAGVSSSASIEETPLSEWNRNLSILATGYFLVSRAAFRLLRAQGRGGSVVFVASKNGLVAGKNAAAYSTAKAAEIHLARCLAEEGGAAGIRVNTVNPDAVLQGSQIWNSAWREQRAATYGIRPDQLEEHYRQRTVLKVNVLPEDIAEAVSFLAGPRSAKTTGCILAVDGGVTAAYSR